MISIITVNWNAKKQLQHCIKSLSGPLIHQTIVVDNASNDDSEQFVANLPQVTLIRSNENLGFAKACNLGAKHANAEFFLFLNPDAAVFPDTLERALAYMQAPANSKVGICSVQLLDIYGDVARSCARFPTPAIFLALAVGLNRLIPRLGHHMAEWPHQDTRDVDQVIGAFFLVRRNLFEALGGFDERFFMYFEEVDFSFRARQHGWRCVYLADVQAFHAGGGTSKQVKARRLFYSLRSRLLYSAKHFSPLAATLVFLTTLLLEPFSRSTLALARRSLPSLKETWHGYFLLWRWLPQWLRHGTTR